MTTIAARHQIIRIRRDVRSRWLTVTAREVISAHMLRIHFGSDDLADFESAAFDDHIKIVPPGGGVENGRPAMRDYTPRAFDTAAGTFVIDFALHQAGPATRWATTAQVGDKIQIGGPKGSAIIADDFAWYMLIGDETALPAIGRRLEELRQGVPVIVIASATSPADRFALPQRDDLAVHWSFAMQGASDIERLTNLLDQLTLPSGEGYVWIAGEAALARALRVHVIERLGHPREWVKAAGYWSRGVADSHERIED